MVGRYHVWRSRPPAGRYPLRRGRAAALPSEPADGLQAAGPLADPAAAAAGDPAPAGAALQLGELVHRDIKSWVASGGVDHCIHADRRTRVRGIGWECLHVRIDDASSASSTDTEPAYLSRRFRDALLGIFVAIAWRLTDARRRLDARTR